MKPYYQSRSVTIYHGDCLEIIPELTTVDLVVTDPPYGINTKSDGSGKLSPWADLCNAAFWYAEWLKQCRSKLSKHGALWSFLNWRSLTTFQKASCDLRWPIESLLVWDKGCIGPGGAKGLRPIYELVALFTNEDFAIPNRSLSDVQKWHWPTTKKYHPAEKPVQGIEWLINASGNQSIILDPFMGSGTTLVAAQKLGRGVIGIEQDERYCEVAAKRLVIN